MTDPSAAPTTEVPDEALADALEAPPATAVTDEAIAPSLLRSSAIVAMGTALSRLTGFGRLFATAYAIGFERLTDAYTQANTAPNIVYELLLGGVLSATLVPVFVRHHEEDDEDGTSAVVTVTSVLLVAITVVGIMAAPWVVRLLTIGVPDRVAGEQREVATQLLRLFMPQMFFYGLTALLTALLNSRRRFAAPAFAPVLNNLVVMAVLFALPHVAGGTPDLHQVHSDPLLLWLLGAGTTAGIVAMTLVLIPRLKPAGIRLRYNLDWRNKSVRLVGRMSGWTLGYVVANQAALLVVLILANRVDGGVSAYTGAFIFFLLPHALFAVSIMTTLVPELSACAGRLDWAGFRSRFSMGLRLMALVIFPAATGYVVLAHPIVTALLEHGALSRDAADLAGDVLMGFGCGLPGFSVYLYTLRGFYAMHDTRTPFFLNLFQNTLQVGLCVALQPLLGVPGLSLAYGIAYSVAALVALWVLKSRVGSLDARRVGRTIGKVTIACGALALAVLGIAGKVGSDVGVGALVRTTVGLVVGGGAYVVAVTLLRVDEVVLLRDRLMRRLRPGGAARASA